MSDSAQQHGTTNEQQLSDDALESVAGGTGEFGALPGLIAIRPPIVQFPGDDGGFPTPVPVTPDLLA